MLNKKPCVGKKDNFFKLLALKKKNSKEFLLLLD